MSLSGRRQPASDEEQTVDYWTADRKDKYGRNGTTLDGVSPSTGRLRTLAVVVTMPKQYRIENPNEKYLVNVWESESQDVTYHATRPAARRYAEQRIAELRNHKMSSIKVTWYHQVICSCGWASPETTESDLPAQERKHRENPDAV